MSEVTVAENTAADLALVDGDRLSLGVAARLSRYLQVLIQARKMGKETISSQELSEYTHVNSTQIRRDLSGFGKFGKRGVGYNVDSLVSQIRKILRTSGQHNIALFGAGHLGRAIAWPRCPAPKSTMLCCPELRRILRIWSTSESTR